jgi:hypothetical protein
MAMMNTPRTTEQARQAAHEHEQWIRSLSTAQFIAYMRRQLRK